MQSSDATDSRSNSKSCTKVVLFSYLIDAMPFKSFFPRWHRLTWPLFARLDSRIWMTMRIKSPQLTETIYQEIWDSIFCFIPYDFISTTATGVSQGYQQGDYFKPHTDGSWSGSRITSKGFQSDAYGDRHSQLTFLILLTDSWPG